MSPTPPNLTRRESLRSRIRRLGAGKLLYRIWHAPRAHLARLFRTGVLKSWKIQRGKVEMQRFVESLPSPSVPPDNAPVFEVHLLTGRNFIHQTLLCLLSLQQVSSCRLNAHLYDDGTLDPKSCKLTNRIIGNVTIHSLAQIEARLDYVLPHDRFPTLREQRTSYPQMRKITDIHAGRSDSRLVLDSDMLFFQRPHELMEWQKQPEAPLFMKDCEESYGYPRKFLQRLAGRPLPDRLNVGVAGLDSGTIDWSLVEDWVQRIIHEQGTSYYLEQAVCAMIAANQGARLLPASEYIVRPSPAEAGSGAGTLQHYVSESRESYYLSAWRIWESRLLNP